MSLPVVVAGFVISILALLVSVGAVVYARRQAIAAEQSVALQRTAAQRYSPPWRLTWGGGDAYLLTNEGDEAAHDVQINLGGAITRGELQHDRIGPRSAVKFLFVPTEARLTAAVRVTWAREPSGQRMDWSQPLPAKD